MAQLADADSVDDVPNVLLLLGRTDEALGLMGGPGQSVRRFKILAAQDRLADAMTLLASKDAARDEEALQLRVAAAELLHGLGDVKGGAALLDRVAKENEAFKSHRVYTLMGDAAGRMGLKDQSWAHHLAAIKLEAEREGEPNWSVWHAFDGDGAEVDGRALWAMFGELFPQETFEQRLARARGVNERTVPLNELTELAGAGSVSAQYAYAAHLFRETGQRMRDAGDEAGAAKYMEAVAADAPAPPYAAELYQRLGDWAAERREWSRAATWYARAWNADRTQPGPLYLRGWALRQAGWNGRAGEMTHLAHVLPLADAAKRQAAMKLLYERGLTADVAREAAVILRTSRPDLSTGDFARRQAAEQALRASDPAAAATAYERLILEFVDRVGTYTFIDDTAYVRLPHTAGRARAKALLAGGDVAAAERAIAACRASIPGDVMLAIDVVPEFERLGDRARADALYAEAMAAQEAVLKQYPDSASHHNSLAWLAVICGRDPEKAMAHARRAVALRPDNAAGIDTLAEAQFRQGDVDAAIKSMTRCIELEPKVPRHREQLERFEAAKRGEQRPMPPG